MKTETKRIAGWREWVSLPELGIGRIKAKLDTGARTSALHAFRVEGFRQDGADWVRFAVHPMQRDDAREKWCEAPISDVRRVINPGGRIQFRIFIKTDVRLGDDRWPIELSLTDRDDMGFRMLLGRGALHGRLMVDPQRSYRLGKPKRKKVRKVKKPTKTKKTLKARKLKRASKPDAASPGRNVTGPGAARGGKPS